MPKAAETKKRDAFALVINVQNGFGSLFSGLRAGFIGKAQENSHRAIAIKALTATPLVLSSVFMPQQALQPNLLTLPASKPAVLNLNLHKGFWLICSETAQYPLC